MDKYAENKIYNDAFLDMCLNGQTKEAAQGAQGFTRNKLREESFAEKILTPIDISNDELTPAEDPELQVKWLDREPDIAPGAVIPLGVAPENFQFKGTRVPIYFSRLATRLFSKDIDKLRGYTYDIRQVMLDLSTKDLATTIDTKFMDKVDAVCGVANTNNPLNNMSLPQFVQFSGGLNRQNLKDAFKVITRLKVPFGPMQPDGAGTKGCLLVNNTTAMDILGMERSEAGGDLSQTMFTGGKLPETLFGVKSILTIKDTLVPDGYMYLFSSEEFFGKYMRLQPLTVYLKNEAYFLNWFSYLNIGMSITNCRGVCKIQFT